MKAIRITIMVLIAVIFYGIPPALLYPKDFNTYTVIGMVLFYVYSLFITGYLIDKFNKWFKSKLK